MTVRLTARRVLRPDGSLLPGAVTIEGALISAVEDLTPDELEKAPDVTLAPGLIDMQVNGYADMDVASSDADTLLRLGDALAARGTTSWCPTLTSRLLPAYDRWLDDHPKAAPGEIGLHLEGPFISHAGAHRVETLRDPDLKWLDALPDRVRLMTLAPERNSGLAAIARLVAAHKVVALGHSDASYSEALAAAGAGATLVTHVFNAMAPLHHRDPGLAGAALTDDRLIPAVIGDGVHVHPAILGLVLTNGPAVLVSDSVAWERPGLTVEGGAARMPGGGLAGSVVTLAEAVRVAVHTGNVPLGIALQAATSTPAAVLGELTRGRIAVGGRADLVTLDTGLGLEAVWVGGERVRR